MTCDPWPLRNRTQVYDRAPFGAEEIGEGSTLPVLGAVAHAIANATGVWIKDLPITPEKILKALRAGVR
jgi:CO/xanthine dehydrogenase Mo-binding subunit